jgi:hypothetical protein
MTLTYSIADMNFRQTKSIGNLNASLQLLETLANKKYFSRLSVLSNSTIPERLTLPPDVNVSMHDSAIKNRLGRIIWDQWKAYSAARKTGNEWLFLSKGFASFLRSPPGKLVAYGMDAVHYHYKEHYPNAVPFLEQRYFEACFRATLKYSRLIVTISEFTKYEHERYAKLLGIKCPLVEAVGIGFRPPPRECVEKENRVLVITSRWPHKRPELAMKFLEQWQKKTSFAGQIDWIGSLPADSIFPQFPNWKRHSRLPEKEFRRLMASVKALVYFSGYEGFGMPPIEAIVAGTCPVYSDLPATREVTGGAGCPFNNESFESFSAAVTSAFDMPPGRLEAWAAQLLARHDWNVVAERTVAALRKADTF